MNQLQLLKSLIKVKAPSTCLITLIIKSNCDPWLQRKLITKEISTATNIKDKTTKKNVLTALKSINYILKNLKKNINGTIICCGISDNTLYNHKIHPPLPIKKNNYMC